MILMIVLLVVFTLIDQSFAQERSKIIVQESGFEIHLEHKYFSFRDEKKDHFTIRNYYEFTDESKSGMFKLPSRDLIIAIPPESKVNVALLSATEIKYNNILPALNPEVEMIDDSTYVLREVEYSDRRINYYKADRIETKGFFWLREFYCIHLKIHTHSYDEKSSTLTELSDIKLRLDFANNTKILPYSPLEIKSQFDENLRFILANSEIAEQFRGKPQLLLNDTTGNWINYFSNYLKIGIASDGLYRITRSDLINWGVNPVGINPKTFQLFESGIEKPIYVLGESDFSFDNEDYIEFYGTKNYSKISPRVINANNQPYNNYLDKYTDTTFYFLTWGSTDGIRAKEITVYQPSVLDSLTYYTQFIHSEKNEMDALFYTFHNDLVESQFPFWDTGKGWYQQWLATWATPVNYTISLADKVPNKIAKFYAKIVSRASSGSTNVHRVKLLINGTVIDSQVTSRYQRVLLQGSINSDNLISGNNTLSITYAEANGASGGQMLVDWAEAEYPRVLKLINNSLYFEYRDITSTGLRKFKIENVLTSNYLLFKVKPEFQRITTFNLTGGNLYFTDTVSNDDAYYLVRQDIALTPKFFSLKTFENLRSQTNQVDYLGISHPNFLASVNDYVNFISSNYSITSDVYSVEDIYDEFGYGYPTAEAIRNFIIYKFQNASTPKPSYLVLFGDANYDYKKYRAASQGIVGGGNFVPSHGFPISDPFYTVWDSTGARLPQMYVGRIPLNKNSEMSFYKSKVQNNLTQPFDDWNKRYLFFSGGRADYPSEIALYKSINDSVINNFVKVPPLAGSYYHFYKTTNPLSDFGPYTSTVINNAIEAGGVFISYIGHSGTATWDNSISSVRQLKNKINRNPIISDFGCSTNKFAEPDLVAFGERFVLDPDGEALGYIGNSALGFVSTAIKAPGNFYKNVIQDTVFQVGKAHISAKYLMFQQLGSSNVVNEFSFSNTLLGDPIIKFKIPPEPNISISDNDILYETSLLTDALDSLEIKIVLNNFGTVIPQTFKAVLTHSYQSSVVEQLEKILNLPNFKDTITFWVQIKDKPGQHTLHVNLDSENSISEIYENDNEVVAYINVASAAVRDLFVNRFENPNLDSLIVLNPSINSEQTPTINFQLADNENFLDFQSYNFATDTFSTKISFQTPINNNRSWLRYKIDAGTEWSNPLTYTKSSGSKYFLGDFYSWGKQNLSGLRIINDTVRLSIDTVIISIISAGSYSGQYCIISKNGINLLSNTFFQGIGIVVFHEKTLEVESSTYYELFNNPAGVTACTNFINSIPSGKLVALGVSGDAKNNLTTALSNAVVSLGGTLFPSIQFKAPYALIGGKGINPAQVKQILKTPFEGPIQLDTAIAKPIESGLLVTTKIGPSSEWKKLKVGQVNQNNSEIKFKAIGFKLDGTVDTLPYLTLISNEADLNSISANTYPFIKIRAELKSDSLLNSPLLSKLEVDYKGVAELGTNFQAVKLNKDTVDQGEKSRLNFYVYNAGEAKASNFIVQVEVKRPDNSSETVLEQFIDSIGAGQRKLVGTGFITEFEAGDREYKINIDPLDQVLEYYNDNNIFYQPFFIRRDTTRPIIHVLFNGQEIVDGDYVSSNPIIRIELNDPSLLRNYNSNSVSIKMDDQSAALEKNAAQISYEFNPNNPKLVVDYKPFLEEGEHTLKIFANDGLGNFADTSTLQKRFIVSNSTAISNIYNFPNPISENTNFTFELAPNLPDEVRILVYTISGRLVKKLIIPQRDLRSNFNKIYWDTRDEDGDLLSNGTYLYKVIMQADDKTETSVHKLAIVRQ